MDAVTGARIYFGDMGGIGILDEDFVQMNQNQIKEDAIIVHDLEDEHDEAEMKMNLKMKEIMEKTTKMHIMELMIYDPPT
ncbi:hypothetical protein TSUD_376960 [Trifolium subterraneum]|uniref:Uncharacterized protein n=1 Tax=Trifolium subterraneum TaxID=3900 RepID=A0A2Z6MI94_TRISU|nr:hypothetical protein TSUD_376960 [Trifolium subterraneum]